MENYCTLTHTFFDLWEEKEVVLTFQFSKPGMATIKRLYDVGGKNPAQAMRNLLIDLIHPEEKASLLEALEAYSGITATLANALMKGMGIIGELGK